jgi:hypothetical protein
MNSTPRQRYMGRLDSEEAGCRSNKKRESVEEDLAVVYMNRMTIIVSYQLHLIILFALT